MVLNMQGPQPAALGHKRCAVVRAVESPATPGWGFQRFLALGLLEAQLSSQRWDSLSQQGEQGDCGKSRDVLSNLDPDDGQR